MKCETCRFADWDLTATGRKSPRGGGLCKWQKTFTIAASASLKNGFWARGVSVHALGGHISRAKGRENPAGSCGTWQPISKEKDQ